MKLTHWPSPNPSQPRTPEQIAQLRTDYENSPRMSLAEWRELTKRPPRRKKGAKPGSFPNSLPRLEGTASPLETVKSTQGFTGHERISTPHDESVPSSPGNRHSRGPVGIQGKRPFAENAVSVTDPRRGMT